MIKAITINFLIFPSIFIIIFGTLLPWFINPIYSILSFLFIIINIGILLFIAKFYYLSLIFLLIYAGAVIILFIFVLITIIKDLKNESKSRLKSPNNLFLLFNFLLIILFSKFFNNFENLLSNKIFINNLSRFEYNFYYVNFDIKFFVEHLFLYYYIFVLILFYILLFILIIIILLSKQINENNLKKKYWVYFNKYSKKKHQEVD